MNKRIEDDGYLQKRFLFRMSANIHQMVRMHAAARNISMGAWILEAILQRIRQEEKNEAE